MRATTPSLILLASLSATPRLCLYLTNTRVHTCLLKGLMVASGAMALEDAYKAVDLDTITLLLGTMIVVANLRLSGFSRLASGTISELVHP